MQQIEVPARFPDGPGSLANVLASIDRERERGSGSWGPAPRSTENITVILQFTENTQLKLKVTLETA